ncbi:MAG: C-terminal binding protein [Firmicutes bacterium]|nr:C-terminal binding protein [Bacillota bacterium]
MEKFKVLVINDEGENIDLEKRVIEEAFGGNSEMLDIEYIPATNGELTVKKLPEADGVITVYTEFDRSTLEKMPKCKVIATQTIGINTIDLDAATEMGICVTNVPDYCVEEVAMHTVTLALSCARKIGIYDRITREKVWNVDDIYKYGQMHRLTGQTYGLVSFGNIAKRVAEMMKMFGMKIKAYDPFLTDDIFAQYGVEKAETLEELFSSCDIISLHTPLTAKTEGMIGMELIRLMPESGILINTSRGGIVKEDELYEALKTGVITAAGVDVIIDETEFESPLYELDNVIITPHVAYYTEEALEECRVKAADMVGDVIGRGIKPKYLVNKNVIGSTRVELA